MGIKPMGYLNAEKRELPKMVPAKTVIIDDSQENLLGVFSILLAVAKRTNPEKYLSKHQKSHD